MWQSLGLKSKKTKTGQTTKENRRETTLIRGQWVGVIQQDPSLTFSKLAIRPLLTPKWDKNNQRPDNNDYL